MDSRQRPVAIFWDFENCPLPNTAGVCEVDKIRRIAQEYGPIKVFKAYLELYEQCSAKTLSLRSELQSCGVTLTDCPHNGRKDVADKMMLVDMMTFAMDNEAPATVIVLSGDRDFVYAISTLRLRGYHVVVIAPKQGHINLRYRASEVLDWDVLVLQGGHTHSRRSSDATVPPPSSEASQGTRESTYASSSTSTALLSPLPKLANGQSFVDDWNATLARPSRARTTSVTHPASASDKEGSTTCTVNGCTPADRCLILDLGPSKSAVPEVEDVLMSAKSSTLSEGESELSTAVNMSSAVEMTEEDSDSQSFQDALQSPYADADTPLPNNTTGESVTVANNKVDAMQSNLTIAPLSSLPLSIPPSKGVPALTLTICVPPTKPTTPSTLHTIPHDVKPPDSPQIPLPTSQHTQLLGAASLGSRPPEVALGAGLPSPVKVPANVKAVSAQETADARRFVHLIRSLDEARLAGNTRVLRTDLAQLLLKRSSNVYKDIGISTFKQYVTLAQTCGIVTVGGTGNSAWVSLQPKWHGHGRP